MIAGEMESTFNDSYDFFSFGKKSKQPTPGSSGKPKVTLGQRLQKVGEKIEQAGGIEGIGRTADNVRSLFRKSNPNTPPPPSDYEIGLKKTEEASTEQATKDKDKNKKKKNLVMTGVLVTGGILVLGGLAWWMSNQNKQRATAIPVPSGQKL